MFKKLDPRQIIIKDDSISFVAKISTMGNRKMVIYVPLEYHKDLSKRFKDKPLLISVTEAVDYRTKTYYNGENKESEQASCLTY